MATKKKKDEIIYVSPEGVARVDSSEYSYEIAEYFEALPDVAKPLMDCAKSSLKKIEKMLYSAPSFINMVKASIPEQTLQAVLTDDQKTKIASGALKLMTKKDGSLMANLVNPETNKIISTIPLQSVNLTPALTQAMTCYAAQMQMAQIAEEIQEVQAAIEEVRQGQEYDRLATAYSCQQKLLQAMKIRDSKLKAMALLHIASDAEDSRNLLMQSQNVNVLFIKSQPESLWGKIFSGAKPEKIESRMNEIRESLVAVNMVSLAEAMAYQEMGENDAAVQSLGYYASFIKKTYLDTDGLVERLDLIDPSPENYWSKTLPNIEERIMALPGFENKLISGGNEDGSETV